MEEYIIKADCKKDRKNIEPRLPIPEEGDPQSDNWSVYYGRLEGGFVAVPDPAHAEILSKQGFFGRSSHTYISNRAEVVEKRVKFGRKKDWKVENEEKTSANEIDSITVVPVASVRNYNDWILSYEEALFLSYALGVLVVSLQNNKLMTIDDMWRIFIERRPSFPVQYAVYHHYRNENWIVKNGLKSGFHWALYPDGPPFCHAKFLVWVKCIWDDEGDSFKESNRTYSITDFSSLERVASSVTKNLLICTVVRPRTLLDEHLNDVDVLKKFHISDVVLQRFIPDQF